MYHHLHKEFGPSHLSGFNESTPGGGIVCPLPGGHPRPLCVSPSHPTDVIAHRPTHEASPGCSVPGQPQSGSRLVGATHKTSLWCREPLCPPRVWVAAGSPQHPPALDPVLHRRTGAPPHLVLRGDARPVKLSPSFGHAHLGMSPAGSEYARGAQQHLSGVWKCWVTVSTKSSWRQGGL